MRIGQQAREGSFAQIAGPEVNPGLGNSQLPLQRLHMFPEPTDKIEPRQVRVKGRALQDKCPGVGRSAALEFQPPAAKYKESLGGHIPGTTEESEILRTRNGLGRNA